MRAHLFSAAFHLTQLREFPLFFIGRCGGSSSQYWCSKLGSPAWDWDLSYLRGIPCSWDIPHDSPPLYLGLGSAHFISPHLLPVLNLLLLYILSYCSNLLRTYHVYMSLQCHKGYQLSEKVLKYIFLLKYALGWIVFL